MVDIVPFTGYLYNQGKAGQLDRFTAPPYDVISPQMQDELYERSPHNIVRLILGKQSPDDHENDNRYTRSAIDFQDWIEREILVRDKHPAYYVYSQKYFFEGERICRTGFFARVRTEDFSSGNICPHEFTLAKAKKDRTLLLEACRANFSPIFGLFSDPQGDIDRQLEQVTAQEPLAVIEDQGITHRLWRITDKSTLDSISETFREKKIYIADGHHRYETALAYHKNHGHEVEDSAHVMMFLTNLDAQSLSIYPIHRLIKCPSAFNQDEFLSKAEEYFEMEPMSNDFQAGGIKQTLEREGKNGIVFCTYVGKGNGLLMRLKDKDKIIPFLEQDEPADLKVLDVAQLHTLVLRNLLAIDTKKPENQQYVTYKVDAAEGVRRVNAGEFDLAIFMNPTRIQQVRSLAENGVRLPQKATFFYPKLLSGLVINKFGP